MGVRGGLPFQNLDERMATLLNGLPMAIGFLVRVDSYEGGGGGKGGVLKWIRGEGVGRGKGEGCRMATLLKGAGYLGVDSYKGGE